MPACAQCAGDAALKCSACSLVYYCSKEHQKAHWKAHKEACIAYKIAENEDFGRYIVANRDIKAGSVIMKKSPIVVGPKMASKPICLGCHQYLISEFVRCSICKWPLCSSDCESGNWHRKECRFLANASPPNVSVGEKSSKYAVILPMRAMLLKFINKKHFDELMLLQSHIESNKSKDLYGQLGRALLPVINKMNIPDVQDIDPLMICSIFDTNAFEVRNEKVNIRGIYPVVSFLAHNCIPNTRQMCDADFSLSVMATRDIRKGEMVCTTYTQSLWPTISRRRHLRNMKHFDCMCPRCSDPTELQTFIGSLKCQSCSNGLLLSTQPLNYEAMWTCNECGCVVNAFQIETMNSQIRSEILNAPRTPKGFESLLKSYTHLLHDTNTHILEIKYALLQLYEHVPCAGNAVALKRRLELCQELLKVSHILEPGCSKFNEVLENSIATASTLLNVSQSNGTH